MSGEPTEAPTPRRLREARARGEVAHSPALTAAAALLGGLAALAATLAASRGALQSYVRDVFAGAAERGDGAWTGPALRAGAAMAVRLALPVVVAAGLAALLVNFVQVGPLWARPRSRWGGAQLGSAARGAVRAGAVLLVALLVVRGQAAELAWIGRESPGRQAAVLAAAALGLVLRVALVLAAAGLVELLLARRALLRKLRMTRRELLRELRESEGDPAHRHERDRLSREAEAELDDAGERAVRNAICVVAGERLAVALSWSAADGRDDAPLICARGRALLSARVLQAARRAGIPVYTDPTLARALWAPVGSEVAPQLWNAVAALVRQALPARAA